MALVGIMQIRRRYLERIFPARQDTRELLRRYNHSRNAAEADAEWTLGEQLNRNVSKADAAYNLFNK